MSETSVHVKQSFLSIIVHKNHPEKEPFSKAVVVALREYADAVERGIKGPEFGGSPSDKPPICGKIEQPKRCNQAVAVLLG